MNPELIIIRGLPGSGKSTHAKKLAMVGYVHVEADMYFIRDGVYLFDPTQLKAAHCWCYHRVLTLLQEGKRVVVSNTFTTLKELNPYLKIKNINIAIVEMTGQFGSIHNVPEKTMNKMKARWQSLPEDLLLYYFIKMGH